MLTSRSGITYDQSNVVNNNNLGWYRQFLNDGDSNFVEADIFNQTGGFVGTADNQAALDNYLDYLSENPTGTGSQDNSFNDQEFAEFKDLSLELADRSEQRDMRLMDNAFDLRNREYQRNNARASNLYNIGNNVGLNSSSVGSYRYDGLS